MADLTASSRIGDWTIVRVLGVGTVGTVYLVEREKSDESGKAIKEVGALKILQRDVSTDEIVKARFQREIEILQKLSHPNVVAIHDSGRHRSSSGKAGDQLYYVMEFVDGPSLKEVLAEQGRLDWKDAVEIGWQICSALQHAHNMGVIHRDLKPANLFLTQRGEVKLGDFGIALDTGEVELTATGLTVGTYAFMSPEQIRGERAGPDEGGVYRQGVTGLADIYALGCLLYRMIAGENPFGGANFAQIFDQHLNQPAPSVRDRVAEAPVELDRLLKEMMAKDPAERPYNARCVQGRLAEALMQWDETEGEKLAARPATWAIDSHQPILSNIIRPRREDQVVNIGWRPLIVMALAVVALIAAAAMAR